MALCVLVPFYGCVTEEDRTGAFRMCLYNDDGLADGGPLRWASENHYIYASACLLEHGHTYYDYIFQLSLDSGSLLSADAFAASVLALVGFCYLDGWIEIRHPEGFKSTLEEDPRLNAAVRRAAKARYTQHKFSQDVLLATGRAALIGNNRSDDRLTALIELMEVRTFLRKTTHLSRDAVR